MNLDRVADLFSAPFEDAKPTILRGAFSNPQELFGESHIQQLLADPEVLQRVGLYKDWEHLDPKNFPEVYTQPGIQQYRAEGYSLLIPGVQRKPGPVKDICHAIAANGWPTVHGVAIETPPYEQSLEVHWDVNPVVAIQTAGRKTWYVFDPFVTNAEDVIADYAERDGGIRFTDEEKKRLVPEYARDTPTLEAGDAYFIPAGWPHFAASTDVTSLHVSICPLPQVVVDKYAKEYHMLVS